ncbi:MAG: SpoIVB peptidase S55 domain-containing protein [Synergistaceae bacterium]|nr:SpoIVB peptidase S55 domain-containing protein [Synergistaceae bacterium]
MYKKIILAALCILMFTSAASADVKRGVKFVPNVPILPLVQLKPGMTGEVHTVLNGTKIIKFGIKIVGVVPRKSSPKNLILFRITDKKINDSGGVAAGMSGSPLYVNGKLIGALGYSWSFSDRSLGLATPIEEMAKAFDWPDDVPGVSPSEIPSPDPVSIDIESDESKKDATVSKDIKPLAMPLLVDGISSRIAKKLSERLGQPLVPLGAASGANTAVSTGPALKPGAAMGVALSWGDVQTGGIGTLSAVDKTGRFLAFAHPMMDRGAVAYSLTRASIIQIIPSANHSFKLGYMGDIIGTVTQDRPEAIGGKFGQYPPASSYSVRFSDIDTGKKYLKRFQTVSDQFIGPTIGTMGILGVIDNLWGRSGEGTAKIKYRFSGGNMNKGWERTNIFFSDKDLIKSLLEEFDDLSNIFSLNQFREIRPYGVDVDVEITREPKVMFIEGLEIVDKKKTYSPGDKVVVDVTLRKWRKQPERKRIALTVPENAFGFCEIVVRGGCVDSPKPDALMKNLRSIVKFDELLKKLSAGESNNQLIVKIDGPEKKNKKKSNKTAFPEDLVDSKLNSEIKSEQINSNKLKVYNTDYYVDGKLKKYIKIKSKFPDIDPELLEELLRSLADEEDAALGRGERKVKETDDEDE